MIRNIATIVLRYPASGPIIGAPISGSSSRSRRRRTILDKTGS